MFPMTFTQRCAYAACASIVALTIFAGASSARAQMCDEWQTIDGSTDSFVRAMLVFKGDLIVGGDFTQAGSVPANRIARWDGTDWHALGQGLNGTVYALAEFNGDLIAGGIFTQAGSNPVFMVARWDGTTWHAMGDEFNGTVHALFVYNDQLIAGGDFSLHLAHWNGTDWMPFPGAPDSSVNALAEFNGDLVAGGSFVHAGGIEVDMVARWDGNQWHPLQPSNPSSPPGTNDGVQVLHVHQGSLYIGGFMQLAGGELMRGITRWDGTDFHQLNGGVFSYVFALTTFNDLLIVGGAFNTVGGINGISANNIAAWDGTQWITLDNGASAAVKSTAVFNGDVFAGGFFTQAGDSTASYLASLTFCGGPSQCPADINGSGGVDVMDLLIVINNWGACPAPPQVCPGNITNSGSGSDEVNVSDLLAVINAWGACP